MKEKQHIDRLPMALSKPPKYLIKPSSHFRAQVSSRSHIGMTIKNIISKLSPTQLEMFKQTRFGHFLDVNIIFNGQLIHYLLLREVEEEKNDCISFMIGDVVCNFGRREFDIITGLWHVGSSNNEVKVNNRLRKKFFDDRTTIYASELEEIFLKYGGKDEDGVKLALIYLIELALLGKEKKLKIDTELLGIIDDWATFHDYDWGALIFEHTLWGLKKALNKAKGKKKGAMEKYNIMGFPHALQVWAYESISTIKGCVAKELNDNAIPRMLRWSCSQSPNANVIHSQVFDLKKVKIETFLEMTEEEKMFINVIRSGPPPKPCLLNLKEDIVEATEKVSSQEESSEENASKEKCKANSVSFEEYRSLEARVLVLEESLKLVISDISEIKLMLSTLLKTLGKGKHGDQEKDVENQTSGKEKLTKNQTKEEHEEVQNKIYRLATTFNETMIPVCPLNMRKEVQKEDEHSTTRLSKDEMSSTLSMLNMHKDEYEEVQQEVQHPTTHEAKEEFVEIVTNAPMVVLLTKSITVENQEELDVMEIPPFSTIRPYVRIARKRRASVSSTTLSKRPKDLKNTRSSKEDSNSCF